MVDKNSDKHEKKSVLTLGYREINIDPGRMIALCDGIFGMVMTLLIFGIELPELQFQTAVNFETFMINIIPTIGRYATCFILVGAFWVCHHEFIKVKHLTVPFVWLNLLYLLCISFIPFTTMIMGRYARFLDADLMFGLNIIFIVVLLAIIFTYADRTKIIEEDLIKNKKNIYATLIIISVLTFIVTGLNYSIPGHYIYLYLIIPIISSVRDIMYRKKMDDEISA